MGRCGPSRSYCTGLVLEGRHSADMGWISELRRNGDALTENFRGGGAIAGTEYLSSVEKLKPKLQWEKSRGEDFFPLQ